MNSTRSKAYNFLFNLRKKYEIGSVEERFVDEVMKDYLAQRVKKIMGKSHIAKGCVMGKQNKKSFPVSLKKTGTSKKAENQDEREKVMWATSMLGWYENREFSVELPESLKKLSTQTTTLAACEQETETGDETKGY